MTESPLARGTFSGPIRIEEIAGQERWMLLEPFAYCTQAGRVILAPAGMVTDFASVPRALWAIYSPFDHGYRRAAVIHDLLYAFAEQFSGDDNGHISRGYADGVLLEAMEASGFRASGRRTVWMGVRVGGWVPWRRYRSSYRPPPAPMVA